MPPLPPATEGEPEKAETRRRRGRPASVPISTEYAWARTVALRRRARAVQANKKRRSSCRHPFHLTPKRFRRGSVTIEAMPRTILAILPLLTLSALSQQPPPAPIDPASAIEKQRKDSLALAGEWLQSQDPRTRAWGAYLVFRDRLTGRIPDLLSLADNYTVTGEPASLTESDDHDAMLSVLDSLIQMRVDVPADTAMKLYPEFPAQSVILMATSPSDNTSAFIRIFQTETDRNGPWLAAGNVLVEYRAPGFAAAVLSSLVVHAQVYVTSGDGFGQGFGGGFGGSTFGEPRIGWPEIGTYLLSPCGAAQKTVLVV
jgi:hypothetical protein